MWVRLAAMVGRKEHQRAFVYTEVCAESRFSERCWSETSEDSSESTTPIDIECNLFDRRGMT